MEHLPSARLYGGNVTESPRSFADRLRDLRTERGLSQYALARKSGLTKQAVSRLELGDREPTWQTVQLLTQALGVDCRAFVDPLVSAPNDEVVSRAKGRPKKQGEEAPAKPAPKKRGKGK